MSGSTFLIVFIIFLVVAAIIVNKVQQIFMKLLGADTMLFDAKKKLGAIVVLAMFLTVVVDNLFG